MDLLPPVGELVELKSYAGTLPSGHFPVANRYFRSEDNYKGLALFLLEC